MTDAYPLFTVSGSAEELGRQHGEQAKRQIVGYLGCLSDQLKLSRQEMRSRALEFLPLFQKNCPHLLEEAAGLAAGAGLELADALACQLRGELGPLKEGACTSFAISGSGTATGEMFAGQNSDNPPELMEVGYVLRVKPNDGRPDFIMWTFGGMLGYFGVNRHGVSHFANSLGGGPKWNFALAHYSLKRMIFEQTSVPDVVQLMRDMPVCSNGNYMLCDGSGNYLDVELNSDGPQPIEDTNSAGFLVHANHYLCSELACEENHQHSLPDSFHRQGRMEELIGEKFGEITLDDVKGFLSDHGNDSLSICRHPYDGESHPMLNNRGITVASIIVEPTQGKLHVSRGNPCENPYVEYSLDD